jgi:hypothetical protein
MVGPLAWFAERYDRRAALLVETMLPLGNHRNGYSMVAYAHAIEVDISTVDELMRQKTVDLGVDLLVIDAQVAELMIHEGSRALLVSENWCDLLGKVSAEPLCDGGGICLEAAACLR